MTEISERRLNELIEREVECYQLRKQLVNLDKPLQENLSRLESYRNALSSIAWSYGGVSVESMLMISIAKNALYK